LRKSSGINRCSVARNVMQAYRYGERGYESRSGKPVMDEDGDQFRLTTSERWKKGLGFQPTRVSEKYRKDRAGKLGKAYWEDKKDAVLDRWTVAVNRYGMDSEEADKAMADIRAFNETAPAFIPPVSRQSLKNRLSGRQSGRDRLLKEAYQ